MTTMVWLCKKNGYNKNTEMGIIIETSRKKTYGMTQNKMVQPDY
jgi:hypothetical protein